MSVVIGLTGGIASGKTTIANLFQQHYGIDIVDADVVAREVVAKGSPGLAAIEQRYGQRILLDDGSLNRSALRETIFSSDEEKQWVNALLHPMIRQKMVDDLAAAQSDYVLFVVPLLIENQLQTLCDRILVVDVSQETQISRTTSRDNVSEDQVRAILSSQASREERLSHADDIIENQGDSAQLLQKIAKLHQKYLEISRQNR